MRQISKSPITARNISSTSSRKWLKYYVGVSDISRYSGLKHELVKGENLLADGIYGAEDPLVVRALGAFSKPNNYAMEKRVC